jgi:rhodanese-related sulfurtransferase/DNA-binding transcriptional ArsR family regulator
VAGRFCYVALSITFLNTVIMSESSRRFKDSIYTQLARIGKALSAPKRLELIELLCECPRTVDAIARLTSLSVANASQHLHVLLRARLVESQKKGLFVEYRLADERVLRYLHLTHELAESRLAEIRDITMTLLKNRDALEAIPAEELLRRVRGGEVTVLDVRPVEEYCAGHIPGAISAPLSELNARISQLPKKREIVAYCRGRYCVMAIEAARVLRKAGYRAHRMEHGVMDWRARGWRIERASVPRQGQETRS